MAKVLKSRVHVVDEDGGRRWVGPGQVDAATAALIVNEAAWADSAQAVPVDLGGMTKAELVAHAEAAGIDLAASATKSVMIKTILAG